jgi:hypothetical protein
LCETRKPRAAQSAYPGGELSHTAYTRLKAFKATDIDDEDSPLFAEHRLLACNRDRYV